MNGKVKEDTNFYLHIGCVFGKAKRFNFHMLLILWLIIKRKKRKLYRKLKVWQEYVSVTLIKK